MGGWKRLSGNLRSAFREPRNADVIFDEVMERFQIFVAQRPVLAIAIVRGGLEVEIAQPVALPSPDIGPPSHHTQAPEPHEGHPGGGCIRLLQIAGKPIGVVLTGDEALNGTGSLEQILGEITMLELEERFVFSEISIWLRAASLH